MVKTTVLRVSGFRRDRFEGPNRFRGIELNFVVVEVKKIFGGAKVSNFNVEFVINQNIFGFNVAVGNSVEVKLFQPGD